MADYEPTTLLIWARDLLQKNEAGEALTVDRDTHRQFLVLAINAIERVLKLDAAGKRPRHRPSGTGMGAQVERHISTGKDEDEAIRAVAKEHSTALDKVRKAWRWHRRTPKAAGAPPKAPKGKAPKKSPGRGRR
jgi:hypothetical protein